MDRLVSDVGVFVIYPLVLLGQSHVPMQSKQQCSRRIESMTHVDGHVATIAVIFGK